MKFRKTPRCTTGRIGMNGNWIGSRRSSPLSDKINTIINLLDQSKIDEAMQLVNGQVESNSKDDIIRFIKSCCLHRQKYQEAIDITLLANGDLRLKILKTLYTAFTKKLLMDYALKVAILLPNPFHARYLLEIVNFCQDNPCNLTEDLRSKILKEAISYLKQIPNPKIYLPKNRSRKF